MRKLLGPILIIMSISFFVSCKNRDENGATDVSNLGGSKNRTDSTRGTQDGNSTQGLQTDTMHLDSLHANKNK